MLQRVQLIFDEQLRQDLLVISEETNQSMSQLVRRWLGERIALEKKKLKKRKKKQYSNIAEALLVLANKAEALDRKYGYEGPTDGAINHDHYLYGAPKKKIK